MLLEGEVETAVVHPVGTAVNREHQRVLAILIEVRWPHDPSLHFERIGVVPDGLHITEPHALQHVVIHVSQPCGGAWVVEVETVQIARLVRARDRPDGRAVVGEGRQGEELLALGQLRDAAVQRDEMQAPIALA